MMPFSRVLLVFLSLGGIFFAQGCRTVSSPNGESASAPSIPAWQAELRRENALRSFIRGATLDATGSYAEAILEYQEALQVEPSAPVYYALSRDFARLGKHPRAIETAQQAVRLDSLNITYRENLALVYVNSFHADWAIQEFEAIVRIDTNSTTAWYQLARLLQPTKPLRALEIYDRLLEREGEDLDILFQSAAICSALNRHADAADRLRRMVELDPANRALQRQLADELAKSGNAADAITLLERLLAIDQNDVETIAVLADAYLDQKQFSRATELYEQLLKHGITNPEVRLRIGVGFFVQGERDSTLIPRAKALLEQVRDEMPGDWRPYWYLGAVTGMLKEDSASAKYFQRVTEIAPWNADAWWYLGSGYFDKGQFQKSIDVMERARKALPRDHRFPMLLGLSHSRLNHQQQAIDFLEQAYKLDPRDMNVLSSLALAYDGAKRYTDSDRLYEEALTVDPKAAIILNNYGYSLAERGLQMDRALGMAKEAVAAEPENPSYLDTLGWIYFKLGRFEEAREYIEHAVRGEASSVVQDHLGDVYFKLGDAAKALGQWKKALELDPSNAGLRQKVERGTL